MTNYRPGDLVKVLIETSRGGAIDTLGDIGVLEVNPNIDRFGGHQWVINGNWYDDGDFEIYDPEAERKARTAARRAAEEAESPICDCCNEPLDEIDILRAEVLEAYERWASAVQEVGLDKSLDLLLDQMVDAEIKVGLK